MIITTYVTWLNCFPFKRRLKHILDQDLPYQASNQLVSRNAMQDSSS